MRLNAGAVERERHLFFKMAEEYEYTDNFSRVKTFFLVREYGVETPSPNYRKNKKKAGRGKMTNKIRDRLSSEARADSCIRQTKKTILFGRVLDL